ncbi:MAG: hypothetical protein ACE37F_24735 [Nannocystaceae bacterium]|nr:hypothetical protein [bacterium]
MRRSLWALALVASLAGCESNDPSPAGSPGTAEQGASRSAFEVEDEGGNAWASATPEGSTYRLEAGGAKSGKLSIEPDRVKAKDSAGSTTAKVKAKDYGFKIYKDDETAVMKVKRKGAGFKIQTAEGAAVGELATKSGKGELSGDAVEVVLEGGKRVVRRGGAKVGAVSGDFSDKAASFLALTELPMAQRVAAMVFVQEHES